ncbi:hypothetical protein [Streptomyces flaveolus]|uniref:hypothetical protein n=1 Tax=Streptomyces flaveolus TaxID=67297 RepID=UPI0033C389A7
MLRLAVLLGAAALLRKIAVAVAGGVYGRVADGGAPVVMFGAAALFTVAAYRCGHPDWKPKPKSAAAAETPEAEPGEEADADTDVPAGTVAEPKPTGPPPISPAALVAAVRDIGTPHAQLKPLAEHLGTTTDVVRATAAGMGWQVKDVRMAGRSASAGLRWDEVPSPPPADPFPSVVGAGQPADDNDDDIGGEGPEKGVRVVRTDGGLIVYDLADTHRRRGTVSR